MDQLPVWVGAGLITAGVSAALLSGAGVAAADTGTGTESNATSSESTKSDPAKSDPGTEAKDPTPASGSKPTTKPSSGVSTSAADAATKDTKATTVTDDEPAPASQPESESEPEGKPQAEEPEAAPTPTPATPTETPSGATAEKHSTMPQPASSGPTREAVTHPTETVPTTAEPTATEAGGTAAGEPTPAAATSPAPVANHVAAQAVSARTAASSPIVARAQLTADVAPTVPSVLGLIGGVIGAVVVNVGSIALTALQAVEALFTGPPVLPPNSTVSVRDSWIVLSTGQRVAANWYFPKVADGADPPTQMILLNHGFLALGPMYSFTAATLAEQTNSIVVTPSLPSNMFLGDDYWLGGTGMSKAIADLFVGKRAALTQSALDAGYAAAYGLDPETAQLPTKFGLAGHSLGGNLVSGAAGFLAANGGADNLVGVILLDGVPLGSTLPDALDKLADYEATPGGHYIPVREIGAPWNLFNSLSNVNEALTEKRTGRFNGVVLTGGVHMDSMRGGNPLIQFSAYVVAGFPQPQNPPAVDQLAATWFTQWFRGDTSTGDNLVPGSTIDILTPQGNAHGVVIGTPPAGAGATPLPAQVVLAASSPSTIPQVDPTLTAVAA